MSSSEALLDLQDCCNSEQFLELSHVQPSPWKGWIPGQSIHVFGTQNPLRTGLSPSTPGVLVFLIPRMVHTYLFF
jgi:hypothetical protein